MKLGVIAAVVAATVVAGGLPTTADGTDHAASATVTFRAADGVRLAGFRFGRGRTAVVFAHELGGGSYQWLRYARRLAARGYLTLAFDFRGYGRSQRPRGRAAYRYAADVTAAAKRVRAFGARRVILVGASMGGTAVVVGAANARPPVDAVVALSAAATIGQLNGTAAARRVTMPILYAVGDGDVDFVGEARTLYDATASQDKRLEIAHTGAHGVRLLDDQRVRTIVEAFVASHRAAADRGVAAKHD